jgi:hypothetical protein
VGACEITSADSFGWQVNLIFDLFVSEFASTHPVYRHAIVKMREIIRLGNSSRGTAAWCRTAFRAIPFCFR